MMRISVASSMISFLCATTTATTTGFTYHRLPFGRLVANRLKTSSTRRHLSTSNNNVISSTQSATAKKIRALLSSRKKRLEYGATVVEGPRPILDLLSCDATRSLVQQILIEQGDAWDTYYPVVMKLITAGSQEHEQNAVDASSSPMILPVTSTVMRTLSDTVTPQGIVAVVTIPQFDPVVAASSTMQQQQQQHQNRVQQRYPLFLVFDAVSDPGNLGTLLRSCAAVGASGVILLPGSTDPWNPKALRASMGCAFQVPIIVQAASWRDAREMLQNTFACRKILAATMLDDDDNNNNDTIDSNDASSSMTFWDVDWTEQGGVALIIGNEGNGLCADIRDAIYNTQQIQAVHVPMQDTVESLNAGVCGSVILFEYLRQCRMKLQQQQQQQQQGQQQHGDV